MVRQGTSLRPKSSSHPALIERFDLVGMDPRGIENTSQVRCSVPVITPDSTLFQKTEQQFNQLRNTIARSGSIASTKLASWSGTWTRSALPAITKPCDWRWARTRSTGSVCRTALS